jgi:MFS family permease
MNRQSGSVPSLPPIVKQLGVVSFLNDLASEMVYPLLPTLVTARLGGSAVALGLLDGIADAAAAVLKMASGWLGERPKLRRPLVTGGYAIATVTRPMIGLASSAWHVIALRATDRVGKGIRNPPRDTVIADATPAPLRGRAFGFHRSMDHAGAIVGPVVAWMLLSGVGLGPEAVIVWSVVPGLLAVIVVSIALSRLERTPAERAPADARSPGQSVADAPSNAAFGLVVGFAFVRLPETLLLLRLENIGVSVALIPLCWAALHGVRSAVSYPGGRLSDRVGPRRTMLVGWLVYATVTAGLASTTEPSVAVLWFLIFGLVAALTEAPERALVAAMGTANRQGRRFGAYHGAVGLAALPGAVLLGWAYAAFGGSTALGASAGAALALSVLGAILTVRRTSNRE